ncbi:unnamed protein product [Allacma fusca]|uniref:RRM domain-containing protein n=1 Tax=Allacma fusca TaxID=39272 RepID=A0A8J2KZ97_9HEXA|nr:unnamed protein product [Allacma fusca]
MANEATVGQPESSSSNGDYVWDQEAQKWKPKGSEGKSVYFDGTNYVYQDKDGTLMFWDEEKSAWFPKIDDDFMAKYQLSYGANSAGDESEPVPAIPVDPSPGPSRTEEDSSKGKNKRKDPEWFEMDERANPKVYVSNLPLDLTEEEFVEFMGKCGLVAKPDGKNYNLKMYKDSNGEFKGDAVVTYIKVESVDLALQILDGAYLKDKQVKVERAKFTLKGEYDPSKKPKTKKRKDKEKAKKQQERLFSWKLDPLRNVKEVKKSDKIVIVANAFHPDDFEGEKVSDILEYSQDFREEAGKCGVVKKLTVHDRHPDGIVQITMSTDEEAQAVITLFNGRFFGGRQIQAYVWDGVTKYHVEETDEERAKREQKWTESLTK